MVVKLFSSRWARGEGGGGGGGALREMYLQCLKTRLFSPYSQLLVMAVKLFSSRWARGEGGGGGGGALREMYLQCLETLQSIQPVTGNGS